MWCLTCLQLLLFWHAIAAENSSEAGQLSKLPYVLRRPPTQQYDKHHTLLKTHPNSEEIMLDDPPSNHSQATPWERMAHHMPFDLISHWHTPGYGYSTHSTGPSSSLGLPALLGLLHVGILCYVLLGVLGLLQRLLVSMPAGGTDRPYYGGPYRSSDYASNEFVMERGVPLL